MSKPCNSCWYSQKIKTGGPRGDTFFICEKIDCRMPNVDYVKECKDYKPKKYNRKEMK